MRADASLRLVWFDVRLLGEVVYHAVRDAKLGEQAFLTRGAWRQYLLGFLVRGEAFGRSLVRGGRLLGGHASSRGRESESLRERASVSPTPARVDASGTEPRGGRRCRRAGARSPRARADRHARRGVFVRRYAFSASSESPRNATRPSLVERGRFGEILVVTSGLRLRLCWVTPPPARDDVGGASARVHHPRR